MDEELRESLKDNLIRPLGIAQKIGVNPSAIANYRRRYADFPAPVSADEDGANPTFWWPEMQEWLELHDLPHRGRKRKMPVVVYVVSHWYDREGSTPVKAFMDKEKAEKFADSQTSRLDTWSVRYGSEGFSVDELELD